MTETPKRIGRPPVGATHVGVRVPPALLASVDAWIAERRRDYDEEVSRPEAIRRLAAEALTAMGIHKLG